MRDDSTALGVDVRDVLDLIETLGAIGRTETGVTRLAFSEADRDARALLIGRMRALDLHVDVDAAGNIFGTWGDPRTPSILIGSHIDTVPDGGIYDGCLGVAAALATIAAFKRQERHPRIPLRVASFQMEESSRFSHATFGSKVFAGRLAAQDTDEWRDLGGQSLRECMAENGLDIAKLDTARYRQAPRAYLELHIDQGVMLRETGTALGVVTGIAAPLRIQMKIVGEAAHSGAAMPEYRRDALMAAGRILSHVEDLVEREHPWGTVATVGMFQIAPNVMNVVPGEVTMGLDVRGVNAGSRQRLARSILQVAAKVSTQRRLEIQASVVGDEAPVALSTEMIELLEAAAREEGVTHRHVVSMAGHDAMQVAAIAPAGMLLVRNVSGTSHSGKEWVSPEDIEAGCRVLYRAIGNLMG